MSELLAKLIEAGTPAALVAEVAMELAKAEALQGLVEQRRAKDRERKRLRNSEESTESAETSEKGFPLKVSPQTPLPKTLSKTAPLNPPVDRFKSEWNAMATKHDLPTIDGITRTRLKALRQRIAEHGEEAVSRAIANVPNSPHWLGANGWRGNFDSLMRPDNFQRMLENTYAETARQKFVSPSGYEYRGDLDAIIRESEKRADWATHYAAKSERDGERRAA